MSQPCKPLGCLKQSPNREEARKTLQIQLLLGPETGIADLQVMTVDSDGLIPELKVAGFHTSNRYLLRVYEGNLSIALGCTQIYPHASRRVTDTCT